MRYEHWKILIHYNLSSNVFVILVPPCVTEENIRYSAAYGATNLNPSSEGVKKTPSYEECRQWCNNEYPGQARFFTWNKDIDMHSEKWRTACFCKTDAAGKREHKGFISGNVDCNTGGNTGGNTGDGEYIKTSLLKIGVVK